MKEEAKLPHSVGTVIEALVSLLDKTLYSSTFTLCFKVEMVVFILATNALYTSRWQQRNDLSEFVKDCNIDLGIPAHWRCKKVLQAPSQNIALQFSMSLALPTILSLQTGQIYSSSALIFLGTAFV